MRGLVRNFKRPFVWLGFVAFPRFRAHHARTVLPSSGEPPQRGPNGWPKKGDPIICAKDGKSYSVIACETSSLGLCRGSTQSCTESSWGLPQTPPPAEWPCAIP